MTRTTVEGGEWIRRYHPASGRARTRLVCFPHAGGTASAYYPFSRALPPSVEALCVQYPGREDRRNEDPVRDIQALADDICTALAPWHGDRLALFGHSMGAIVAFEVAWRLQESSGSAPVMLFASGRRAPSVHLEGRVHLLGDADLVAELKSLSGTAASLFDDAEMMRLVLPSIRSDYQAIETYRCPPGRRLGCPVTAFVGDRDDHVSISDARSWAEHTTGEFGLEVFPGGHFYLNACRQAVVTRISHHLDTLR
jgi:pyochelin biosynthetic protein PchC